MKTASGDCRSLVALALRISRALAEAGAAVAINYRERRDEAMKLAEDLRKTEVSVIIVQADVPLARYTSSRNGRHREIRIGNDRHPDRIMRGLPSRAASTIFPATDFDQTIATKLKSVFLCTQAVLPMMRVKKWGRIVNISAGAARGAGCIWTTTTTHPRQALRD